LNALGRPAKGVVISDAADDPVDVFRINGLAEVIIIFGVCCVT
jgi:hypothetical protein